MFKSDMKNWLDGKIAGVNHDLKMDDEVKAMLKAGRDVGVPFGDRNESWLESIKGRKKGWMEISVALDGFQDIKTVFAWLKTQKGTRKGGEEIAFVDSYAHIDCELFNEVLTEAIKNRKEEE